MSFNEELRKVVLVEDLNAEGRWEGGYIKPWANEINQLQPADNWRLELFGGRSSISHPSLGLFLKSYS